MQEQLANFEKEAAAAKAARDAFIEEERKRRDLEAAKEAAEREREENERQAAAAAEREKNKSKWGLMRNEIRKRKMRKMAKLLLPKPVAGKDVAKK